MNMNHDCAVFAFSFDADVQCQLLVPELHRRLLAGQLLPSSEGLCSRQHSLGMQPRGTRVQQSRQQFAGSAVGHRVHVHSRRRHDNAAGDVHVLQHRCCQDSQLRGVRSERFSWRRVCC